MNVIFLKAALNPAFSLQSRSSTRRPGRRATIERIVNSSLRRKGSLGERDAESEGDFPRYPLNREDLIPFGPGHPRELLPGRKLDGNDAALRAPVIQSGSIATESWNHAREPYEGNITTYEKTARPTLEVDHWSEFSAVANAERAVAAVIHQQALTPEPK